MTAVNAQALIEGLLRATGVGDPFDAVRIKAKEVLGRYVTMFGPPNMPFDVEQLASFVGIVISNVAPTHSKDAELIPVAGGRVSMRLNRERPEARQRFSISHEIVHTFFPSYEYGTSCRNTGNHRRRDKPEDLLEMLCDAGAAELLMPVPWFADDAGGITTAAGLVELAQKYGVSREAVLRRFVELHPRAAAAVFFSWKLKPTEIREALQPSLFERDHDTPLKKLRVNYSVANDLFSAAGYFIPADKSVRNAGPLYEAARLGETCEGECALDLANARGRYRVLALPMWTDDDNLGPAGETAVGAVLEPIAMRSVVRTRPKNVDYR